LVLIFGAVASLIGNGTSAHLSLKLGEGKKDEAKSSLGSAITISILVALFIGVFSYVFLPTLIRFFGSTETVYSYALSYGRIISIGAPFVIIYTTLSNIIRTDGSPAYSMIMLVVGAIINIILDPIFIFGFDMGVQGGAIATVIGQIVSCVIALLYIPKIKSISLEKKDFKPNQSIGKIMGLGLSSFITQMTVLVLFVFMNNMLTRLGLDTKYGADIPLSVYGIISKVNSLYISTILGIAIGAQPIIGFNYGAGERKRVQETLRKVLIINFVVGIFFNILFVVFPKQIIGLFITEADSNYVLFMEFAVYMCHSFVLLMVLNALEITTSIVVQSLGNVVKATLVSFTRQILLFIPIACLFGLVLGKGIYGVLWAGPVADSFCFIFCLFIFGSEYLKLGKEKEVYVGNKIYKNNSYTGRKFVITISREYGSGGRYVGRLLAEKLGVNFYDKELISLTAKKTGLSEKYVSENEQKKKLSYENNNDDQLFIAETKVIQDIARKESCVIVGRCADYILNKRKDVISIFLYSDEESKVSRVVKYYGIEKDKAQKEINKINKERAKHYKFYTERDWYDKDNYDLMIYVDKHGVEKCVEILYDVVCSIIDKEDF